MTESMKFGPEWLRNLSQDGCTQPSVMSAPRCQLAEHRYGREEMLALFDQMVKAPDLLSSIPSLYVEKTQEPLALQQMTEDETRMWNRGINSDAVLRMSGKTTTGIPGILRGGRGGSIDRGRGRGRGSFHYSRGLSYEEPGDGSLRDRGDGPISSSNFQRNLRTFDRSQNSLSDRGWSERNGADAGDWNGSSSPRKEVGGGRGFINDNWRRHRGGGEDEDGWRTATSSRADKWGRSNSWREGDKDGVDVERSGTGRGQNWERGRGWDEHNTTAPSHHPHRRPWDEDIPEWANENPSESGGSFDASGAFHGGGYSDDEDEDEGSCGNGIREPQSKLLSDNSEPSRRIPVGNESSAVDREHKVSVEVDHSKDSVRDTNKCEASSVVSDSTNSVTVNGVHDCASDSVRRQKSEDDMERMKEVADDLVAKLMDDEEGQDKPTATAGEKWFYRDPQGEVQGPFLSGEMAEWFRAGYFALNLLVRRSCDERYAELGDLIKLWGSIPFLDSNTTFPPLKATDDISTSVTTPTQPTVTQGMSTHASLDQGNLLMQHYRYQLLQHQYLLRQQAMAGKLTQNEYWSSLSPEQQQLIMQHLQPPVDTFVPPVATAQKNPVMNLLSQLHQPKVPTTSVPDSPLSPSHSHPPALDPLQQLIQQMGGLQPSHHSLHTATSKPDADSSPIQMLMRQLGSKTVKPQLESVWGGSVMPAAAMLAAQNWLGHMPAAPPGQFPLSSLWDLQGKDIKTEQQILEEQMQAEEERRREELRKQEETQRRTEEEEKRKQLEEELRKKEEEQQRMKEKLQKMEEERKRLEEQQKQKLAEEAAERKRQQEEAKRLEEEAAARKREEAARKKEEERKRKEEEKERKRKLEEERKREEEEKQRQEEELARKKQQQEEEERRLEQQRRQTEALRRLQEQQQQRTKAAPWSQQTPGTGSSLADIQRQEKEKKERDLREQQQLLQQELQAQALAAEASASANRTINSLQLKWAERKPVQLNTVKSLTEIQAEEQEQLVKQQEKERQERAQQQKEVVLPPSAGIWGAASQSLNWTSSGSTVWGSSTPTATGVAGFWDEVAPAVVKPTNKAVGGKTKSNPGLPAAGNSTSVKASGGKTRSKKEEALVMKLFEQNVSRVDEFTQWCSKALSGLQSSVDIPTFVGFLRDIESPYEVKDYVRLYLGEGKEVQEFAKQFLERRSKWRSAQKAAPLEDDMCVPAPAVNPLNMDFQEVKGKSKKTKKSKMFRVDNRILGFNVTAAQDRINVGDRDYGEM